MKKVKIDEKLKEIYPDVCLGCLFYEASVEKTGKEFWEYLDGEVIPNIQKNMSLESLPDQENIRQSREAYKKIGKEPSRYRVSSEALLRRILQGKGLYKINNVVDTNNLISIETGYSAGSYDLDCVGDELVFRIGKVGEEYKGIGKEMVNIENLPVFADENGPYGSPTSDSERAMIKNNSKQILTVLISFSGDRTLKKDLEKAEGYLAKFVGAKNIKAEIVK